MLRLALCCLVLTIVSQCLVAGWSYDEASPDGPSHWAESYPTCGGSAQSPINLDSTSGTFSPGSLYLINYDRVSATPYTLTNSGHSVQVNVNVKDISILGGGLKTRYILEQFHLHWGKDDTEGSEHTIDSARYPLAIHFVHYASTYADVAAAVASGDSSGLAVLGVLVDVVGSPSADLGNLADNTANVPYKGNTSSLAAFALQNIIPLGKLNGFYRYSGSLTTPGCSEVVVWTVFNNPVSIASDKLALLRELHENERGEPDVLLDYNFRPTQAVNGRVVRRSVG